MMVSSVAFVFTNYLLTNVNPVEVHPQLSINEHPVDGVLVHCGHVLYSGSG